MPFAALYDACVLHPPSLRDLLIRIACTGIVQARWNNEILGASQPPACYTRAFPMTGDLL